MWEKYVLKIQVLGFHTEAEANIQKEGKGTHGKTKKTVVENLVRVMGGWTQLNLDTQQV